MGNKTNKNDLLNTVEECRYNYLNQISVKQNVLAYANRL